ncbi:peptidase T [Rodentibacter caecimuris]|uniref:Peptidase T n=1 Tax=Rodentibacter caecimuris TaxID=1796644 RepID=A0ABX3KWB2_9PAST|nr:peptidase T [Rodentibacter heylii]
MSIYKEKLLKRFLHYISFDTQSKPGAKSSPSSSGQLKLAKELKNELLSLGLQNVNLTEHGVLTAFLPARERDTALTIGLISHLDTSPQCSGKHIKAEVIENYRGGDIALGLGEEFISPVYYPFMHRLIGKTLIVPDGTTLLGADNKAGIAEIMTVLEILAQGALPHCHIRVAFTPDEEIGLGMHYFPMEMFSCDWAYTLDGGEVGELEYENFNAATARLIFYGRNMHTGYAKNRLINALTLACEFQQSLPVDETPETTEGKAGFFHLAHFLGGIEKTEIHYLIRDFDISGFRQRKQFLKELVNQFNIKKKLKQKVEINIEDSYRNMYECIKNVPQSILLADQAMKNCGIQPIHKPIRGGTDGAWLAERGVACPNIFTGGYNFHSKHEIISLEGMLQAVEVIIEILKCKEMSVL